jgi:hypothetical protein
MDALIDTAKMIPLLLIIYIGIEFLEYYYGQTMREKVGRAGKAGPTLGALFGCIPQCGFSVITTALYTKRIISVGTLLAVYLSTSDEAIPIILANPKKVSLILPLLLTKVIIAIIAGYSIDFLFNRSNYSINGTEQSVTSETEVKGCCGHNCAEKKIPYKELIWHPLVHTLKVFIFIFVVSLLLNLIIARIGVDNLGQAFFAHRIWQPMIAGLVGLIPNCAASVAITELFLKGGLSFGSTISGLSASAGLGILVLFKENRDIKDSFRIIGLLYGISVAVGIGIQIIYG